MMKKSGVLLGVIVMLAMIWGCTPKDRYHRTAMPDPKSYQAHFDDMDTSGNDLVDWTEFKAYFPQTNIKVFRALDLNQDSAVDHDEWHKFKEAHGLKDHD